MPTDPVWSDAWLLMALVYGAGSLRQTLNVADAINHAIPTYNEWAHACAVLGPRGLIQNAEPIPQPTEAGRTLILPHRAWHTSFGTIVESLQNMEIVDFEPMIPPTPAVLQAGFDEYHAWFQAEIKRRQAGL